MSWFLQLLTACHLTMKLLSLVLYKFQFLPLVPILKTPLAGVFLSKFEDSWRLNKTYLLESEYLSHTVVQP